MGVSARAAQDDLADDGDGDTLASIIADDYDQSHAPLMSDHAVRKPVFHTHEYFSDEEVCE